ncbi:hypothetical protein V6N12_036827 [Hibiscus sabdariffa]|uniref:Uncharacterized protein n=1 Tax=Hibiscus sabdariffa TaxID=183260 RepID=A0ABR2BUU2_9ROSI
MALKARWVGSSSKPSPLQVKGGRVHPFPLRWALLTGLKGRAGSLLCWTVRRPPWAGSELVEWPGWVVCPATHVGRLNLGFHLPILSLFPSKAKESFLSNPQPPSSCPRAVAETVAVSVRGLTLLLIFLTQRASHVRKRDQNRRAF